MKYVLGIDGGGTKTRGIVLNQNGEIVKDLTTGPTNYHSSGILKTKETLKNLYDTLISGLSPGDIEHIFLGLAGADLEIDFKRLNQMISEITERPFTLANDIWCAFKASSSENWGAVSIYGTGANAAAISKKGETFGLRALGHILGGGGGGYDIACDALHFAFRSEEGTYKKTKLETEIPKIFDQEQLIDLIDRMHPEFNLSEKDLGKITPLVFDLAEKKDAVSCEILKKYGSMQGKMLCSVIKKADLLEESIPIVIGGSVFKGKSPLFIEAMMHEVKQLNPMAHLVKPQAPPVLGALLYAQEKAGWEVNRPIIEV